MKTFIMFVCLAALLACQQKTQENTNTADTMQAEEEAVEVAEMNYYGEKISGEGAITGKELQGLLDGKDSVKVKLTGEILSTCRLKGCWMEVNLGENSDMRVTFKDYGFFVPKEGMEGKETIVEGYAKQIETDVETLKHYAEDAGKSQAEIDAITEPKREIAFVANGVIIK